MVHNSRCYIMQPYNTIKIIFLLIFDIENDHYYLKIK